jgi:hypothetical protein
MRPVDFLEKNAGELVTFDSGGPDQLETLG